MVSTKYAGDYRLENVTDPKTGKIKTRPVYRGDYYGFGDTSEAAGKSRKKYVWLTCVSIVLFLTALFFDIPCAHVMYVMMPFAVSVFPLFNLALSCRVLLRGEKGNLTREEKDRVSVKIPSNAVVLTLFAGFSTLGNIVRMFLEKAVFGDVLFLLASAVICAAGFAMYTAKGVIATEVTGTARLPEAE